MLIPLSPLKISANHDTGSGDMNLEKEAVQLHQFAEALGNAVDAKDATTFNHSAEVAILSQMLAEAMHLPPEVTARIHLAGHLHDVGKIGIPDSVLHKRSCLTSEEWQWMKRHPEIGASIVRPVELFAREGIVEMILYHHERFDGRGYPYGLRGTEIPIGARIVAVADTLSALLQDRPYRNRTDFASAFLEIKRCSGSQFDPAIVLALEAILMEVDRFFDGRLKIA